MRTVKVGNAYNTMNTHTVILTAHHPTCQIILCHLASYIEELQRDEKTISSLMIFLISYLSGVWIFIQSPVAWIMYLFTKCILSFGMLTKFVSLQDPLYVDNHKFTKIRLS